MTSHSIKIYNRAHFYLGNIYRLLTSIKYQKTINISEARSIFGASFSQEGWHHIRQTLLEYDRNSAVNYRHTTLYSYLKYFTPLSICDLIDSDIGEECDLPLFVYPWGTFKKNEYSSSKDPYLSRFCGPSTDAFIEQEFNRTIDLYNEIKTDGYRPWLYGNTFIGGTFLLNDRGERRFVVLQGNHRMSILAHLGYENIAVREVKGYMEKISEADMFNWIRVKSGECSKEIAKKVFDLFFHENGEHIDKLLREVCEI